MQQIAAVAKISRAGAARVCRRAGLIRLQNLEPKGPTIDVARLV